MNTAGAPLMGRAGWIVCAVLSLVAGGCTVFGCNVGERDAGPTHHHVTMRAIRFEPESLAVAVGDTVVWSNEDVVPHTSSAVDGAWNSGEIPPDSSWSTVIAQPGFFAYFCAYHPAMKGEVTAAADGGEGTPTGR